VTLVVVLCLDKTGKKMAIREGGDADPLPKRKISRRFFKCFCKHTPRVR